MFYKHSHLRSHLNRLIIGVAVAAMSSATALAEDYSATAQKRTLPGVASDYRIAKPAPEPEPDDAVPSNGVGQFKIGDIDVRISGSVVIDAGAGSIKPSNR